MDIRHDGGFYERPFSAPSATIGDGKGIGRALYRNGELG
jgi:hypothetical protein